MTSTKALDTASLPTPPNIPPSNASYAKIVGAISGAAKHGPAAVEHIRDTVKGTNTYAKMVRRYADAVIAALAAPAPTSVVEHNSEDIVKGSDGEVNWTKTHINAARRTRKAKTLAKAKAA